MKRLENLNVPCLRSIGKRDNVVYIGASGLSRPLKTLADLKDKGENWVKIFEELKITMAKMFHEAEISHGHLTPKSIIWQKGQCYILNLSDSVDADSPLAKKFLQRDCASVSEFFNHHQIVSEPNKLYEEIMSKRNKSNKT